eukprot:TRINITY_DN13146_c0_g1_i2.p1 TRINITY_DN13146_c0_g1~~TRINITY_DN13146_c0_g1_i2.p1  ORF type:complete len:192 (+),score=11.07 TRINITY_DN13146_c0_g1_i2:150-725(+)
MHCKSSSVSREVSNGFGGLPLRYCANPLLREIPSISRPLQVARPQLIVSFKKHKYSAPFSTITQEREHKVLIKSVQGSLKLKLPVGLTRNTRKSITEVDEKSLRQNHSTISQENRRWKALMRCIAKVSLSKNHNNVNIRRRNARIPLRINLSLLEKMPLPKITHKHIGIQTDHYRNCKDTRAKFSAKFNHF